MSNRDWVSVVREHKVSGLSVKDFCRSKEMSVSAFYKWRKQTLESSSFLPAVIDDGEGKQSMTLRKGELSVELPVTTPPAVVSSILTTLMEV